MDQKKTKFQLALPLPLLRGSRPKFVRDSSKQYTRELPKFHPNPFTSGGVIDERVNIVQTRHRVFAVLGEASASSPSNYMSTLLVQVEPSVRSVCVCVYVESWCVWTITFERNDL